MSTLVEATCLCGGCKGISEIPSSLPVSSIICSCSICRYCTGVLFLTCLPLAERPVFIDRLRPYQSSDQVTRHFCGKCGSQMCSLHQDTKAWNLCAGVVDKVVGLETQTQLQIYTQHEFVGNTLDCGLALCLTEYQNKSIPAFMQGPDGSPVNLSPRKRPSPVPILPWHESNVNHASPKISEFADSALHASCHCGGVRYKITRPNLTSKQCSAPWPDLIVPFSAHSDNPDDIKWWLRDGDTKYLAGTCACRSCRLSAGSPIQTWAFVPKANIQKLDGSPLDFDLGTLKQYLSSKNTYREFCGLCGATVFWHCSERPGLIDVSVGLLQAPEGSRAANWLEWCTTRLSFKEDALDRALAEEFEKGLPMLQVV